MDDALRGLQCGDVLGRQATTVLPAYLSVADAAARMWLARADTCVLVSITGEVVGAVTARALRRVPASQRGELRLVAVAGAVHAPAAADDQLAVVLRRMGVQRSEALAVVDRSSGRLVGVLRQADVEREVMLRELLPSPT
jgi:CBS domain-containing protein